jgi:hypothetical protein
MEAAATAAPWRPHGSAHAGARQVLRAERRAPPPHRLTLARPPTSLRPGDSSFFQVTWANLRGYNHWLGTQKELAALRARLAAVEGAAQAQAPQPGGLPPAAERALAAAGASVAGGVASWPGCPAVDLRRLAPGSGCPELEALLEAVVQQMGALEREAREARARLEEAEAEAAQAAGLRIELDAARAEAGRAAQQAQQAQQAEAEARAAASSLEAARDKAEAELGASRQEVEKLSRHSQRLQQRLSDLNRRVNSGEVLVQGAAQGGGSSRRAILIDD